jgi:prophage regulatory protein
MKILKISQVLDITGLSRATLYSYIKNQQFPCQINLGPRRVGWVEDEVTDWIRSKIQLRNAHMTTGEWQKVQKPARGGPFHEILLLYNNTLD